MDFFWGRKKRLVLGLLQLVKQIQAQDAPAVYNGKTDFLARPIFWQDRFFPPHHVLLTVQV